MEEFKSLARDYLQATLGFPIITRPWAGLQGIPFVARDGMVFFESIILGRDVLFACVDETNEPTPARVLEQRVKLLRRYYQGPIVVVLRAVSRARRITLTASRIDFLVPHSQLYMPSLLVDLSEKFVSLPSKREYLSPSSQLALFYLLQRGFPRSDPNNGVPASVLARQLDLSSMTILRAFDELSARDGIRQEKIGRERRLIFEAPGLEVFETFRLQLRSPVTHIFSVKSPVTSIGLVSGVHALSRYSDLAEPQGSTFAIYSVFWRHLSATVEAWPEGETLHKVEVWSYNPEPLKKDGIVDRLSLNAQFSTDGDERIAMAANQILSDVKWF